MTRRPIRRALISVYDKTGLAELAFRLAELGYDIYSTSGTQRFLSEQEGCRCTPSRR